MFREILEKIVDNCDGAAAAVLMGFDGIAVEFVTRNDEYDVQTLAMEFSFVLTQVRKAAEILEVGTLREVTIRSDKLTFIVRVLSDDYFAGLALAPDGNFGKARFLMRMALADLRSQL